MNKLSMALRLIALGTLVTSLTGCLTTLQPPGKRYAVAPGLVLGKIDYGLDSEVVGPADKGPRIDARFGLKGFFEETYATERTGIYLAEPFDPDRIPILFVHGLLDDPYTWRHMTRALVQDPVISENFQFWYFAYPSNLPVLASSALFRHHLDQAVENIEQSTGQSMNRRFIVIGHSMGGMLTKSLISNTGTRLYDSVLTRPLEQLDLSTEAREFVERTFIYKSRPYISKAIFLASPHRGSAVASSPVGQLGTLLASRPGRAAQVGKELTENNQEALTPTFREFLDGRVNSIRTLRPDAPALQVVAALETDPEVSFHTIAGVKKTRSSGDGIVPLESTFIPGALCEAGIYSGHDVHKTDDAATLVAMILKLHIGAMSMDEAGALSRTLDLAFAKHGLEAD